MSAYENLAQSYDSLTWDIPYESILAFLESLLQRHEIRPRSVLDLACGTGSLSVLLAQKGYRVTALDMSEDMLAQASEKASMLEENYPQFICQRMEKLRLPAPVDAVVCCLDSLNYVTDPEACRETFRRVWRYLIPGGAFLFDINTPEKLRGLDGQVFLDDREDVYCVWRAAFEESDNSIFYGIDLFRKEGFVWKRSFEEHQEYAYTEAELRLWLEEAGFTVVETYGDLRFEAPREGEQRIYFMAIKGEN